MLVHFCAHTSQKEPTLIKTNEPIGRQLERLLAAWLDGSEAYRHSERVVDLTYRILADPSRGFWTGASLYFRRASTSRVYPSPLPLRSRPLTAQDAQARCVTRLSQNCQQAKEDTAKIELVMVLDNSRSATAARALKHGIQVGPAGVSPSGYRHY
jgi:hypothetical protein